LTTADPWPQQEPEAAPRTERRREVATDIRSEPRSDRLIRLTKREIEVLSLVLEGKSSREVAAALFCSKRTIDFHLARIYEKLQVSNRVQAMRRATLLGLLDLAPDGVSNA